jgi:lysophospholipase L1-like esterase
LKPRRTRPRRTLYRRYLRCVVAALALVGAGCASDSGAKEPLGRHWVGTWTTALVSRTMDISFSDQTLRQIVHTSIGSDQVRVRLANTFGTARLEIGAAHIGVRDTGADIVAGAGKPLTFGGSPSIAISPGAHVLSDAVDLEIPMLADIAIDLYLPGNVTASTETPVTAHASAFQTSYVSAPGNHTGVTPFPVAATTTSWFFLMGVDVMAASDTGGIVAFGDSITDGTGSTLDTNNRWPDHLARRLLTGEGNVKMGVMNLGIAGNRVLYNFVGQNAQARFDRDVLAQPGVTHVIVLAGINDIGLPGSFRPLDETVTAEEIIVGYKQLIVRAHTRGLKIFGGTLTPFETPFPGYYSPAKETVRQAVNEWIRTSGAFDAVIDFDAATRDPSRPTRFLPPYDGDRLHLSDAGYEAMAAAIDTTLFRDRP